MYQACPGTLHAVYKSCGFLHAPAIAIRLEWIEASSLQADSVDSGMCTPLRRCIFTAKGTRDRPFTWTSNESELEEEYSFPR
jgi:hypothetical protein